MFKEDYKDALCLVCRQSAILEQYHRLMQEGKEVDEDVFVYHLQLLVSAKEAFLKIKKALGYEDGLSFMDDANFYGFKYSGGCLQGDCSKLPDIVLPWIEEEEEDAHFRFEVGILLLSHYFMQRGEYEYKVNHLLKKVPFYVHVRRFIMNGIHKLISLVKKEEQKSEDSL